MKICHLHTFSFAELISDTSQMPEIPSHDILPNASNTKSRYYTKCLKYQVTILYQMPQITSHDIIPNAWNTKSRYYTQNWTTDTTHCAIWTSHSPPLSSLNPSVLLLFGISVLVFSACQIEILTRILLLLSVDDFSVEEDLVSFSTKKTRSYSWKIQPNSTIT